MKLGYRYVFYTLLFLVIYFNIFVTLLRYRIRNKTTYASLLQQIAIQQDRLPPQGNGNASNVHLLRMRVQETGSGKEENGTKASQTTEDFETGIMKFNLTNLQAIINEGIDREDAEDMTKIGTAVGFYRNMYYLLKEQFDTDSRKAMAAMLQSFCTQERIQNNTCICVNNKLSE